MEFFLVLVHDSYPWNDQLSAEILHVCFDLRGNVQLMAEECNLLQISQQIFLGGRFRTLICNLTGQFVQLCSCFGNLLGRIDDIHCSFEWAFSSTPRWTGRMSPNSFFLSRKEMVNFYLVKSVISIMIMHMCLAVTMMSLPVSSHLATSRSNSSFSVRKILICSVIRWRSASVIFLMASYNQATNQQSV